MTDGLTGGRPAGSDDRPVLYVLKRFPRLSETFVLRELLGLEAAGVRVRVDSLMTATLPFLRRRRCLTLRLARRGRN